MSQDYYGNPRYPSSWSVINNDLHDDEDHRYYPSYATETWSVLNSQDVNEDQLSSLPQNNYDSGYGLNNYGTSTTSTTIRQQERNPSPSPSFLEPEFAPSITNSTKGFLETTFKYERKRKDDIVGRPDEEDDDCPPQQSLDSDSFFNDDSQSTPTVSNIESTTTSSSSLGYLWYSLATLVIAVIIYYVGINSKDFQLVPFVELDDIF